jgi:hypothetical protein
VTSVCSSIANFFSFFVVKHVPVKSNPTCEGMKTRGKTRSRFRKMYAYNCRAGIVLYSTSCTRGPVEKIVC